MSSWDTLECKIDGVLAEDARTARTLFGGSARVSKEGGYTQDLADYPRWLAVNARMKFVIPCTPYNGVKRTPRLAEGGQSLAYRGVAAELSKVPRARVGYLERGLASSGHCYT